MSKSNTDTAEILDAIKNMMSDNNSSKDQELPKDVIELTNPIESELETDHAKLDILELSNPISEEGNKSDEALNENMNKNDIGLIDENKIREVVKNSIESLPTSRLDQIITEELTKVIKEKLNSSKIIISTEDKKN